jgi:hypothetical protein
LTTISNINKTLRVKEKPKGIKFCFLIPNLKYSLKKKVSIFSENSKIRSNLEQLKDEIILMGKTNDVKFIDLPTENDTFKAKINEDVKIFIKYQVSQLNQK